MTLRPSLSPAGFTLIETMIAVAIVAVLAAVALPYYLDQVSHGRRSDLQTQLMEDANYLQRYYAANATYATAASLPVSQSPRAGAPNYNITIATQSATGFQLQATRAGAMANDRCGDFTYDNLGIKGLSNNTDTIPNCWR